MLACLVAFCIWSDRYSGRLNNWWIVRKLTINYFDNWLITFQTKMSNVLWFQLQDLLLFFIQLDIRKVIHCFICLGVFLILCSGIIINRDHYQLQPQCSQSLHALIGPCRRAASRGRWEPHRAHTGSAEEEAAAARTEADYSSRQTQVVFGTICRKNRKQNKTMKNEGIEGTERFLSPDKNRGLRAVRHFSVGELVFACPAYSYVLTVNERGAHCENCFTR